MAWIESHQSLRDHPKTRRLCRYLGISRREAIGLLHLLWWWCLDYAPDGDLAGYDADDLADAVDWEGDPQQLVDALLRAGFLDRDRDVLTVHDWWSYAGKLVERRQQHAERMRSLRQRQPQTTAPRPHVTTHDVPCDSRDNHVIVTCPSRDDHVTSTCTARDDVTVTVTVTETENITTATTTRAHAREDDKQPTDVFPDDTTDTERDIVSFIRAVPGMDRVPVADVLAHYREVVRIRGPCSDATERLEAIRFRDYWSERRKGRNDRWRNWKNAVTNWFARTKEVDHAVNGRGPRADRTPGGGSARTLPARPAVDYDRYARYVQLE